MISVRMLLGIPVALFILGAYETYLAFKEDKGDGKPAARKAFASWAAGLLTLLLTLSSTSLLLPTLSINDERTGVQIRDVQDAGIEYWLSTDGTAESWRSYAGLITGIAEDTTVTARAKFGFVYSDTASLDVRVDGNTGLLYASSEKPDPSIVSIEAEYQQRDPVGETAGNHYVGYRITPSDFEVTGTDTAGNKIGLDPEDYSLSADELTVEGDNPILITYEDPYGRDRTYTAHVYADRPEVLKLTAGLADGFLPIVGARIENEDISVSCSYEDGSQRKLGVDEFAVSPDVVVEGANQVTVTFGSKTATVEFDGTNGSPQSAESEPNDERTSANLIETGAEVSGTIGSDDDADWYQFVVGSKGSLDLVLAHDQGDGYGDAISAEVFGSGEDGMLSASSPWGEAKTTSDHIRVPAGRYYVKVSSYASETTGYRLTAEFSEEDDKYEAEPNDDFGEANGIGLGSSLTGNLGTSSDVDMYVVQVGAGASLGVALTHPMHNSSYGSWRIDVFDPNGEMVKDAEGNSYHNADVQTASWDGTWGPLEAGNYYVRIEAAGFCNEDYVLTVS